MFDCVLSVLPEANQRGFESDIILASLLGHYESAGKRKAGATRKGSPWLRAGLVEAAQAAGRARQTYLGAPFNLVRVLFPAALRRRGQNL